MTHLHVCSLCSGTCTLEEEEEERLPLSSRMGLGLGLGPYSLVHAGDSQGFFSVLCAERERDRDCSGR